MNMFVNENLPILEILLIMETCYSWKSYYLWKPATFGKYQFWKLTKNRSLLKCLTYLKWRVITKRKLSKIESF